MKYALISVAFGLLIGCAMPSTPANSSSTISPEPRVFYSTLHHTVEELKQNRELWRSHRLRNYQFVIERIGRLLPQHTSPVKVTVRDAEVVSGVYTQRTYVLEPEARHFEPGEPVPADVRSGLRTVTELFSFIEGGLSLVGSVEVEYDSVYGIPQEVRLGSWRERSDLSYPGIYLVTDFRVIE